MNTKEQRTCAYPGCDVDISARDRRVITCSAYHGYGIRKMRLKVHLEEARAKAVSSTPRPQFSSVPLPEVFTPTVSCQPEPQETYVVIPEEPGAEDTDAPSPFPEADTVPDVFPDSPMPAWTAGIPPAPTGRTGRYTTHLFLSDIHLGDQDDRAVALALAVLRHVQPDEIVVLGDLLDAKGLTRFPHNPIEREGQLQYELDLAHALLGQIRSAVPGARRRFVKGNHEDRIERTTWANPGLITLKALGIGSLLHLAELGFEPKVHNRLSYCNGDFVAYHGERYSAIPGNAARQELLSHGVSGISGHDHSLVTIPHSSEGSETVWTSTGHLQNNPPSWRLRKQSWQQGTVIVEMEEAGNAFDVHLVRFRPTYRCRIRGAEVRV